MYERKVLVKLKKCYLAEYLLWYEIINIFSFFTQNICNEISMYGSNLNIFINDMCIQKDLSTRYIKKKSLYIFIFSKIYIVKLKMIKCFENLYLIILLPDMSPINNEGCSQGFT